MNDAALRAHYDELWRRGRGALSAGVVDVDPLPVDGGPRWGISAVLRPKPWPDALVRCAAEVAALTGSQAFVYPPDDLHITVQQFDTFRTGVPDDRAVRDQAHAIAAVARESPSIGFALRGLTATSGGVLVQGRPLFDLQALRARLHRDLAATASPVRGPEATVSALRTSAHATLAIFGGPVAHADELVAWVDAHRDVDFGTIAFDALWLVGYLRTARTVRLVEYGRFPVGARAGSLR